MRSFQFRGQKFGGLPRNYWRRRNAELDPEIDYLLIYRNISQYEFPWETLQALSLALLRTFAVPSIGELLDRTGEFTSNTQKRYDDTSLLLESPTTHGLDSSAGRTAIRRINQMHRVHSIPNDDLRYVLCTFVVVPVQWIDQYGKRPLDDGELVATVRYYQELGRRMAIRDIPADYAEFVDTMDRYEVEHFDFRPGSRRVADATLALLTSFYPRGLARMIDLTSRAVMDQRLLTGLGYPRPATPIVTLTQRGLMLRGALLRLFPARRSPAKVANYQRMRSYPGGYSLAHLGTFPPSEEDQLI